MGDKAADQTLLMTELNQRGLDAGERAEEWLEAAERLAALDAIARAGGHVIVKVDGGRAGRDVYTVVLAGGALGDEFFRKDGADLGKMLDEALAFFLAHAKRDAAAP